MPDRLLTTKFHIPPPTSSLVTRQRLLDRLHAGLLPHCRLTLVSAPAGYGKSTLVADWIRGQSSASTMHARFAWLSLDEDDNDPVRFLRYLLGALRRIQPELGQETLGYLGMPTLLPVEHLLTPLVNELDAWNEPLVLTLDDYHCITGEAVHDLMRFLLDAAPAGLHLVVVTRIDPPLPLARLRARGQITELRAAQLRFNDEEVASFFRTQGFDLNKEWLSLLEARTEGWVTGLILAAISLQGREDYSSFFQSFGGSHRLVIDYLIDEVLSRQPDNVRNFLFRTAILDRFCAPLCEAVTGIDQTVEILRQIEQANLFLIPLDDQRNWFRYHHLFADALMAALEQNDPRLVADLHRRAAVWLDQNAQPESAIYHALSTGDVALALDIIRHWIDDREHAGAYAELAAWFRLIPDSAMADDPRLLYRKLRVFYRSGDYEASQRTRAFLENRLDGLPADPAETVRWLRLRILFEKAVFASMQGELDQADVFLQEAAHLARPEDAHEQLQWSFYQGINQTYLGHFDEALKAYQVCLDINLREDMLWNAANCLANMLDIYCAQGKHLLAIQTGEAFIQRHARTLTPRYLEGLHAALGVAYYAANQLDQAEGRLRQTYESSLISGTDDNYGGWRLWLARICQAQGKAAEAEDWIKKSEAWVAGFPGEQFKLYAGALRARVRLAQGNLTEAQAWSRRFEGELTRPYFMAFQLHTLAWVRIAEGKPSGALALLQNRLPDIEACGAAAYGVENLALHSLALAALGQRREALDRLRRSLILAEMQGQERLFIDLGEPMAELLTVLHMSLPGDDPIRGWLSHLNGTAMAENRQQSPSAVQDLPESIGDREIEILRLIAEGLTNKDLAVRLHLSVSTVKWYTYNLYGKLGVNSRTQAIQRARELKLI